MIWRNCTARTSSALHGDSLLDANLPLIHTVGRASDEDPRLIDMTWGESGPLLTLVGKGVCFDTGGLNLKPGASMGLMKKDMGGAASVLGLAHMIMAEGLPLRLRVLIPAVENAVAGNAFRPGDILTARDGQTIEINNTDAEGRLVLADALALASEDEPDLMISMATLTGAARVAWARISRPSTPMTTTSPRRWRKRRRTWPTRSGAALPRALRTDDRTGYRRSRQRAERRLCRIDHRRAVPAPLRRRHPRYAHFDIYAWSASDAPGRPKGGLGQGARALFEALPKVLSL
jgi:leucyl aminopeptidase